MSAIKPGDLVMMVRRVCDCPTCTAPLGIPWTVTLIDPGPGDVRCTVRKRIVGVAPVAQGYSDHTGHYQIPTSALKKIDPLPEDQQIETDEEIEA